MKKYILYMGLIFCFTFFFKVGTGVDTVKAAGPKIAVTMPPTMQIPVINEEKKVDSKTDSKNNNYKKAYKKKIKEVTNEREYAYVTSAQFKMPGINVPVLAISVRSASDTDIVTFYKYSGGKVVEMCGENSSGGLVKRYKKYIIVSSGHDSLDYISTIYKVKNGTLKELHQIVDYDHYGGHEKTVTILSKKVAKKAGVKYKKFKNIKFK